MVNSMRHSAATGGVHLEFIRYSLKRISLFFVSLVFLMCLITAFCPQAVSGTDMAADYEQVADTALYTEFPIIIFAVPALFTAAVAAIALLYLRRDYARRERTYLQSEARRKRLVELEIDLSGESI